MYLGLLASSPIMAQSWQMKTRKSWLSSAGTLPHPALRPVRPCACGDGKAKDEVKHRAFPHNSPSARTPSAKATNPHRMGFRRVKALCAIRVCRVRNPNKLRLAADEKPSSKVGVRRRPTWLVKIYLMKDNG
jgi:hypothetical protein